MPKSERGTTLRTWRLRLLAIMCVQLCVSGLADTDVAHARPAMVAQTGARFQSVSAGTDHTCGVRTDETIVCWGGNDYGQALPVEGRFISVSAGDRFTCGVRTDGGIACWGLNERGQAAPNLRGPCPSSGPG